MGSIITIKKELANFENQGDWKAVIEYLDDK